MTNEELYKKIYTSLEELGTTVSNFCSVITKETGKKPNLNVTKSRNSLPNTVVYPYLTTLLNDDEMHEITLKKIDSVVDDGEAFDLLEDILSNLQPSKEYLYKQRLKRRMQREVIK